VTEPTVILADEPVKPGQRRFFRGEVARERLGGINSATLWRLEKAEPLLRAAKVYVGSLKCYDEQKFETFMEDYFNRPRDRHANMPKSPGRPRGSTKRQPARRGQK
jgi:hypothetical protein